MPTDLTAGGIQSEDLHVSELGRRSYAIDKMYDGDLDLLLIRGTFPRREIDPAIENLANDVALDWLRPNATIPGMDIRLLGVPGFPTAQAPKGPDVETYLAGDTRYRSVIDALFSPGFSPARRIEELLTILSNGRPVERPQTSEGQRFPSFTLRSLSDGQGIVAHNDYLFGLPLLAEVSQQLDTRTLVSFFVVLQAPVQGGRLVLFELTQDDDVPRTPQGFPDQNVIEARYPCREFSPASGDMIVFPAGRFFHKVEPVGGHLPRVTLGGLCGLTRDGQRILYWG